MSGRHEITKDEYERAIKALVFADENSPCKPELAPSRHWLAWFARSIIEQWKQENEKTAD